MSTKGTTRNERTGAKVARIAGKVMAFLKSVDGVKVTLCIRYPRGFVDDVPFTLADIGSLAGSANTQSPPKKKPAWTQRRNLAKPRGAHPPKRKKARRRA